MAIAPKILLQKALLPSLPIEFAPPPGRAASGLLNDLKMPPARPYQYESAIAHQLAAPHRQAAVTLAAQLAPRLTAAWADGSTDEIAAGLVAQATSGGWLTFSLSSVSVATWLGRWLDYELPPTLPTPSVMSANPGQWPLCDRLRLSLPMVLQWAHARCQSWQEDDLASSVGAIAGVGRPAPISDDLGDFSTQLVTTVMRGLDWLATRSGQPQTAQQVSYLMAQTIYDLEATRAQWRSLQSPQPGAIAAIEAVAAAQKFLAVILAASFGEIPQRQL